MLQKLCCYIFYLVCFCPTKILAQKFPLKLFTTNDGLINNRCGNIVQDSSGYIWITTDNGICNYDGRKFNFFPGARQQYYFAHNNSINIYKGACIMGSDGQGVVKAFGNSLEFIYPKSTKPEYFMSALQINDSVFLTADLGGGKLQLVTKNKVQFLKLPTQLQLEGILIVSILQDVNNNIWVGTSKGIFVYEKGDLNKPFVLQYFFKKYINVLKQDARHNIFVSSDSAMHFVDVNSLKNIETIAPIKFFRHNAEITAVGTFSNGDVAFSDYPNGLVIYNKLLKEVRRIAKPEMPDVVLWDIFIDREENMWLATENGVYRYGNLSIKNYFLPMPKGSPQVTQGTGFNGSFLFSNTLDLYSLNNGSINKVGITDKHFLPAEFINLNDQLWVNDHNPFVASYIKYTKLYDFANNSLSLKNVVSSPTYNSQLPNLQSAITLPNGNICLLSNEGNLLNYVNGKLATVQLPSSLSNISFNVMAAGKLPYEAVLFSNEKGLFHINFTHVNERLTVQLKQQIPINEIGEISSVNAVMDAKGSIWLATYNDGLYYFTKKDQQYKLEKRLGEPYISSTLLTCITKDSIGNIWVGSNKGIDKVVIDSDFAFAISKGMYKNNTLGNYVHLLKAYNGLLHIGTSGGLTTVPVNMITKSIAPSVYINKIICNGNAIINENAVVKTSFNYNENNFSFEFTSPTFIDETQTEYQYKMDPIDAGWSIPSGNYTVSYNQLPAGNYTFRVRSKNANGSWSVNDAVFSFTIKKPFYKEWWFYLLCFLFAAAVIYWLYKLRVSKILAVQSTRNSISKDLHDDIGTALSSITLMNAVMKNKIKNKPDEAVQMADKIETTSREMIRNMSDIVWSINPGNDTIEKLTIRLQQFAADVFEDTDTLHKLTVDESLIHKPIAMELRRDIYLVCKEIINNSSKYANATQFEMQLLLQKNTIVILAKDNGRGFDKTKIERGNGLHNIEQRVTQQKGTCQLQTKENEGTAWNIVIPL